MSLQPGLTFLSLFLHNKRRCGLARSNFTLREHVSYSQLAMSQANTQAVTSELVICCSVAAGTALRVRVRVQHLSRGECLLVDS